MDTFWHFARRMLRYRSLVAVAVVMALLSAGSLGAGLVGITPVFRNILGKERTTLPDLAHQFNQRLAEKSSWIHWQIPESAIAILPDGQWGAMVSIIAGLGLLTIFGGTANFLHAFLSMTVVQRTVANIRREAFHRTLRLGLKDVVGPGTTDKISRIIGDTNVLEGGFTALLSKAVAQLFKGIGAFGAAFLIEWRLTLAALLVAPVMGVIIRKLGKRIRRASRSAYASQSLLLGAATEALQGLRVVKVHGSERYEAGRFHRINKDVMRQMFRARTARALSSPLVEVVSIIVLGGLSLVATKAILDGSMDLDRFVVALISLFAAGASLKPLTGLVNDIQTSAGAAVRIKELMDTPAEPGHDRRLPRLPRHAHSVEFRGVTFTYPGQPRPALDRVSVTARHGQRVAIVGPNGSGKTTLLALVPRLFDPAEGAILIDGQNIRDFSVRSLRRQVGVVTQETVLFRGTIRGNIAYGADDATEDRVRAAARMARADGFIEALPLGYDALVGDQGLTLSGGQRQRIAIARAILRDPAILILDEATSMIDSGSEAQIAQALEEFSRGRTTLVVAHRLSTVINSDLIVVMNHGRIVDTGQHAELLRRCEVYRQIAEKQLVQRDGQEPGAAGPDADRPPSREGPRDEPPEILGRISAG